MDENVKAIFDEFLISKKIMVTSILCKFDIPDIICESNEPLSAQEIVDHLSKRKSLQLDSLFGDKPHVLDVEYLERVLRFAAASGILTETNEKKFGKTSRLGVLTSIHPSGMKFTLQHMVSDKMSYLCWGYLGEVLVDRHYPLKGILGTNSVFEYGEKNYFEFENFHQTMLNLSRPIVNGIPKVYDFNHFHTVVDIGGSTGHLIKKILHNFPKVTKGINFDLEKVVEEEKIKKDHDEGLGNRYELVGGDFFKSVCTGDCFLLKMVLHDWADEDCIKILSNIVKSMKEGGRVIVIEFVLKEFGDNSEQQLNFTIDLQMMLACRSKERRRDQWNAVFSASGLELLREIPFEQTFIMELKKK